MKVKDIVKVAGKNQKMVVFSNFHNFTECTKENAKNVISYCMDENVAFISTNKDELMICYEGM